MIYADEYNATLLKDQFYHLTRSELYSVLKG